MRARPAATVVCLLAPLAGCSSAESGPEPGRPAAQERERTAAPRAQVAPGLAAPRRRRVRFRRLAGITTATAFGDLGAEDLERWKRDVRGIRDVRIRSSADGSRQPSLWLPSSRRRKRPLLVVLHSWSNGYRQHLGTVFARWAKLRGWAVIAPHFRGVNDKPEGAGSGLAVRDVVDAIDYAARHDEIDEERVFTIGFSGGGMMSLLLAGRRPDRVAGTVAWVPVHDLAAWHGYNAGFTPPRGYASHIERACDGDPQVDRRARRRCERRSPSAHLRAARRARVPVYIGHGIDDTLVRPDHALQAFNQLADPGDRVGRRALRRVAANRLPRRLRGREARSYFGRQDPKVLFSRQSRAATVVLFEGEHDMVFHPGLEWMVRVASKPPR